MLLKEVTLYSVRKIKFKWNFIVTLCAFLNQRVNQFQFPERHMNIILFDVYKIYEASPIGLTLLTSILDDLISKYRSFLKDHANSSLGSLALEDCSNVIDTSGVSIDELTSFYVLFL